MTPPLSSPIDPDLLGRVLVGGGNAEERAVVDEFLRTHPEVDVLMSLARGADGVTHQAELDRARERLATHLGVPRMALRFWEDATLSHLVTTPPAPRTSSVTVPKLGHLSSRLGMRRMEGLGTRTLRRLGWSLGSVATLVAAFFLVRIGSSHPGGTTRSYTTGVNQQGIVTLDDGTRVTLAPQTTLWLRGFSTRNRTVSVDGKAYFAVMHAAGAPFEVRSGSVTARVLGTSFLVDHALHGSSVRVAVEEGKVRVFSTVRANVDVTVTAGHVGEVTDTDSTTPVYSVVDSASRTEWFHGQLVFYHMPVATVLQALSRWYGYQFRCADSTLPQRNVTIGVSVRSSASAFATLEQILGVNLTMTGDTVTLTPQVGRGAKGIRGVRSYDVWIPTREVGR